MAKIRHNNKNSILLPDSKSQITLQYKNGKPLKSSSIVVSTQHEQNCSQDDIRDIVRETVNKVLPEGWMCPEDEFYVNPTGIFEIGGPDGDAGLTGRKIIVDTYGGASPHGGGAFSGKDPTKVDRSAAYLTRYLAKNVVAAGIAAYDLVNPKKAEIIEKTVKNNQKIATFVKQDVTTVHFQKSSVLVRPAKQTLSDLCKQFLSPVRHPRNCHQPLLLGTLNGNELPQHRGGTIPTHAVQRRHAGKQS